MCNTKTPALAVQDMGYVNDLILDEYNIKTRAKHADANAQLQVLDNTNKSQSKRGIALTKPLLQLSP